MGECLLVRACCVVHNYWCMLFLLVNMLVLAFYCLHVDVNVLVLVMCLLFLCVMICVCLLVHACLCVHGIRMW